MAKVILVCGRICCGKTTYAHRLAKERRAAVLSVDEVMLAIFGQHCGDMHDTYAARTKQYLLAKAAELIAADIDVILDWGPWTKSGRAELREHFAARGIAFELHAIEINDEVWRARLAQRNAAVEADEAQAYFVDENLAAKFASRYEAPEADEVDVWITE